MNEPIWPLGAFATIIFFLMYFVPAMVAGKRECAHKTAIVVLNIFAGWTFIGWVAALVWACADSMKAPADPQMMLFNKSRMASGAPRAPKPGSPFSPAPGSGVNV